MCLEFAASARVSVGEGSCRGSVWCASLRWRWASARVAPGGSRRRRHRARMAAALPAIYCRRVLAESLFSAVKRTQGGMAPGRCLVTQVKQAHLLGISRWGSAETGGPRGRRRGRGACSGTPAEGAGTVHTRALGDCNKRLRACLKCYRQAEASRHDVTHRGSEIPGPEQSRTAR